MASQAVTRRGRDTCQCAETIRMPRASRCWSPNARNAAAWESPPSADMGEPCARNTAGFRIVKVYPCCADDLSEMRYDIELSAWHATGLRIAVWWSGGESAAFLQAHGWDACRFPIVVDS